MLGRRSFPIRSLRFLEPILLRSLRLDIQTYMRKLYEDLYEDLYEEAQRLKGSLWVPHLELLLGEAVSEGSPIASYLGSRAL